jgi:hypothetical protein
LSVAKVSVRTKILFAIASTALAAVFFAVVGDPHKFPGDWFGYIGFLVGVFVLAFFLHGKID